MPERCNAVCLSILYHTKEFWLAWLKQTAFYLFFYYSVLSLCAFQNYGPVQQFLLRTGVVEPVTLWSLEVFHYCVVIDSTGSEPCYSTHECREYTSGVFVFSLKSALLKECGITAKLHILSVLASMMAHFSNYCDDEIFEVCCFNSVAGASCKCGNESSKV